MSKILDAAVSSSDGGETYDFRCPGVIGDRCHTTEGVPFSSTGWPTKKAAAARGAQHLAEHKGNLDPDSDPAPMQELEEFRKDQGLTVVDGNAVSVEDL